MASSSTLNAPAAFDDDKTLDIKPDEQYGNSDNNSNSDVEKGQVAQAQDELDWDNAPENPYNFPGWKKALTIFALATMGLTV